MGIATNVDQYYWSPLIRRANILVYKWKRISAMRLITLRTIYTSLSNLSENIFSFSQRYLNIAGIDVVVIQSGQMNPIVIICKNTKYGVSVNSNGCCVQLKTM